MRRYWLALAAGTIADVATYVMCVSAQQVATLEVSPIARTFGPGLESALIAKAVGFIFIVVALLFMRRRYPHDTRGPKLLIGWLALLSFFGAFTNVIGGLP